MVALVKGTPDFEKIFGVNGDFEKFISEFPDYATVQASVYDPSIRADAGLDQPNQLHSKMCRDLQSGSRSIGWGLATVLAEGFEVGRAVNFPATQLTALRNLVESDPIVSSITADEVLNVVLTTAADPKKGGKVAGKLVLGLALVGIGTAIPVVGQIGAAVVAFIGALVSLFKKNKGDPAKDEATRVELYRRFPPLQTAGSEFDNVIINNRVLQIIKTQDFTSLYLPRFSGDWNGQERLGGFAFARGVGQQEGTQFGEDINVFSPTGGLGVIPGTNQCTSVLQVSLDPVGVDMSRFIKPHGTDPRRKPGAADMIVDVGGFYISTGRLCGLIWNWATRPGSPYQYRLDCIRMHEKWKEHCESGIEFIRNTVFPWYSQHGQPDGSIDQWADFDGFYGSAVYAGIGSWACEVVGGTNHHPIFKKFAIPYGVPAEEATSQIVSLYPGSKNSGLFLPILGTPSEGFQDCMGTIYWRKPAIKSILDAVQAQQRFDLGHTLVSAYVRRDDAAFAGDPALLTLLDQTRAKLLKHPDRMLIDMRDVPADEPFNGGDWRQQLLDSGVPAKPSPQVVNKLSFGGAGERPSVPPLQPGPAVPWKPRPLAPTPEPSSGAAPFLAGAAGLVALGLAWRWHQTHRRKNFVDQAPPPPARRGR